MDKNLMKAQSVRSHILAVVVTYNPEIDILSRNLEALKPQVAKICIYDNDSLNIKEIQSVASAGDTIEVINNDSNKGLPINYNRAALKAKEEGYEWLLIMDQDTIIPSNTIASYSKYMERKDLAIISPFIWDVNLYDENEIREMIPKEKETLVDQCISSASLNRVETIIALGGFDEKMFIDYVDFDYCRNCRIHDYKIIQVNDVIVDHRIGTSTMHRFLGGTLRAYNTSPIRKYYYFRNRIYYARKYKVTVLKNKSYYKGLLGSFITLFYEERSGEKMKAAIKGIIDGLKL